MTSDDVFHSGERAVQERAGARAMAARLGPRMVQRQIPPDFAFLLARAQSVYLSVMSDDGRVWVSALAGPPGFARAATSARVDVRTTLAREDPLVTALDGGPRPIGMLVLEPMSRSRIRLNGIGRRTSSGLTLDLRECFGNCPKYIQRRRAVAIAPPPPADAPAARIGDTIDRSQRGIVSAADTFVIGSRHPERGVDASHRGGRSGFVVPAPNGRSLVFPDYHGNTMFQTLGNVAVDPRVGLLFVDWSTGRTLQITGRATIDWDSGRINAWEGAERLVDVSIDVVVDRVAGVPMVWELVERHRLNPAVPDVDARAGSTDDT